MPIGGAGEVPIGGADEVPTNPSANDDASGEPTEGSSDDAENTGEETPEEGSGAFDWTFGLGATVPGLKALITIDGPVQLVRGILHGTQLEKN